MPARYSLDRGTRVAVTSGKYKICRAIIEANVYGYSVDHPEERAAGFQVTVFVGGTRVWATVRVELVEVSHQHYSIINLGGPIQRRGPV